MDAVSSGTALSSMSSAVLRDDAIDGRDTALTMLDSAITDRTLLSQTTKARPRHVSSLALGQQKRVKMLQQMVWDQFADWKADGSISSRIRIAWMPVKKMNIQ